MQAQEQKVMRTQQEGNHLQTKNEASGETNTASTLILDFSLSKCRKNKFLWFKPFSLWYLLWQAKEMHTDLKIRSYVPDMM